MTTSTITQTQRTAGSNAPGAQVVAPGQGDAFWSFGDLVTFKIGPEHTGGAFSMAEAMVSPGGGPPPHVHSREDETFYVLEGTMQFTRGDDVYVAGPGEAFFLPRGIVHTFHNASGKPAKCLVMAAPCGFEKFMKAWATPKAQKSTTPPPVEAMDMHKLLSACASFGLEMKPDHRPKNPPTRNPNVHKPVSVIGLDVDFRLLTQDTNGAFSLARLGLEPEIFVPVHSHREMQEMFYVERGTFEYTVGDRTITATPGTTIFIPRGVKHGFKNSGLERGSLVNYHFPGGFEHFFRELSTVAPSVPFDVERVKQLMDKHGMDVG